MPTVITTPKATNANSYISRAEATAYLTDSRLHASTTWIASDDDDKDRAIIWATALLDAYTDWRGWRTTSTQVLRWPRSGITNSDGILLDVDTIPTLLKNVTAELAYYIIQSDRTKDPALLGLGLKKARVDVISIEVDATRREQIVPRYIAALIAPLGDLISQNSTSSSTSSGVAKLERA